MLTLSVLPYTLGVCRLEKTEPLPSWAFQGSFFSITKTEEELSVVCEDVRIPPHIKAEKNWRAFKVEGPLDFSLVGILASLVAPLAQAKVSIFAVSTFETDYILVKQDKFNQALEILKSIHNILE